MVDVGCAIGDYVRWWLDAGILSLGIEGSKSCLGYLAVPEEFVFIHDLRVPITSASRYSLATCFDVAEHIEVEYVDVFIDNLVNLSGRVLMSAAPPGQEGINHINCQFYDYWALRFDDRGYVRNKSIEDKIKNSLSVYSSKVDIRSVYYNLLCFEEKKNGI